MCVCVSWTNRRMAVLCREHGTGLLCLVRLHEGQTGPIPKHAYHFCQMAQESSVTIVSLCPFPEDGVVHQFLKSDSCSRVADKVCWGLCVCVCVFVCYWVHSMCICDLMMAIKMCVLVANRELAIIM